MIKLKIPTEVYSRVCGYFRPVKQFNKGMKEQFKDRMPFKLPELEKESEV